MVNNDFIGVNNVLVVHSDPDMDQLVASTSGVVAWNACLEKVVEATASEVKELVMRKASLPEHESHQFTVSHPFHIMFASFLR